MCKEKIINYLSNFLFLLVIHIRILYINYAKTSIIFLLHFLFYIKRDKCDSNSKKYFFIITLLSYSNKIVLYENIDIN